MNWSENLNCGPKRTCGFEPRLGQCTILIWVRLFIGSMVQSDLSLIVSLRRLDRIEASFLRCHDDVRPGIRQSLCGGLRNFRVLQVNFAQGNRRFEDFQSVVRDSRSGMQLQRTEMRKFRDFLQGDVTGNVSPETAQLGERSQQVDVRIGQTFDANGQPREIFQRQ